METITLNFKAFGQNLTADAHPQRYASNTVNYIQAVFDLDENWQSFDSVRAVWHNDFACISTVLDGNGSCTVPHEVLTNLDEVIVNLVGSDVDGEELVDRMTTYPHRVAIIDANARICGTETAEVTPSQFEQYIDIVEQIVGTVKDIDHTELTDDYCLIIYYSDGTNSGKLGPIRGATGATGNGIVSAVLNADYTLTLTYDNGDSDTVGPIRGEQGETGNGIQSVYLTETHGAVKTYTILFTDGTTTTFDVTDGEVTLAQLESVLPTDTASGAIASFPDGTNLFSAKSLTVDINPIQDLHGYDAPWVGGAGKNKFDESLMKDQAAWNNITLTLKPNTTYVMSTNMPLQASTDGLYCYFNVTSSTYLVYDGHAPAVTTGDDGTLTVHQRRASGNDSFANYHWQIEEGSTATTFTPYANICPISGWTGCEVVVSPTQDAQDGTTYPISWQTEAGTVYGGTVDVVTGVLNGALGNKVLNGSTTDAIRFTEVSQGATADGTLYIGHINASAFAEQGGIAISDKYQWQDKNTTLLHKGEFNTRGSYIRFVLADQSLDTLAKLNADLANNPIQLVYTKKTADEYPIDETAISCLLGQNNVWADCGNVEVQYKADVQRWVEKMLNA